MSEKALLNALEVCLGVLETIDFNGYFPPGSLGDMDVKNAIEMAREALPKAEGRS